MVILGILILCFLIVLVLLVRAPEFEESEDGSLKRVESSKKETVRDETVKEVNKTVPYYYFRKVQSFSIFLKNYFHLPLF